VCSPNSQAALDRHGRRSGTGTGATNRVALPAHGNRNRWSVGDGLRLQWRNKRRFGCGREVTQCRGLVAAFHHPGQYNELAPTREAGASEGLEAPIGIHTNATVTTLTEILEDRVTRAK